MFVISVLGGAGEDEQCETGGDEFFHFSGFFYWIVI
jgi:hypothetical protein